MMSVMSARPLVVVLDTNVVIAGLLWSGPPWAILVRATDGEGLILATSPALLTELSDTLATPRFRKRIADAGTSVKELVAAYRDATVLLTPRDVPRVVTDDIDDDHVIAAALAVRASHIVTGDRSHLLPIGVHDEIAIVSPRQFLDLLES
jgi:uncharacterized protein